MFSILIYDLVVFFSCPMIFYRRISTGEFFRISYLGCGLQGNVVEEQNWEILYRAF